MNFRQILSVAGLVLFGLGTLDIVGGLGYSLLSAGKPVSDSVAFTFYTQNHRFYGSPQFVFGYETTGDRQQAFGFEVSPRWVERAVLAFDREPNSCGTERGQQLHIFRITDGDRRFYAVGFFLWHNDVPYNDVGPQHSYIRCAFGWQALRRVDYHPESFGWLDGAVARKRLEYLAHTELRDLPAATYPAHDKTMYYVRASLLNQPTRRPSQR